MKPWQPTTIAGPKQANIAKPETVIRMLMKAKRPLLIIGPVITCAEDDDATSTQESELRSLCIKTAETWDVPVVTVGNAFQKFHQEGFETEPMGLIEIVNLLKDPEWEGIRGEGQHDLVIFIGVTYYMAAQGLSTLKHFASHLKTVTLCKYFHSNADASFPNMSDKKWIKYLEKLENKPEDIDKINKEDKEVLHV